MSFKAPFTWTDLQVHQQRQRKSFQWYNFNRPGAFLLLQPGTGYFYFVCQKGSVALHAFSLRNRVSWQHCQEHIISAAEATRVEWYASLVLTGDHKCFRSCHTEGTLSQTGQYRCTELVQEPRVALLRPKAEDSCSGLSVASTRADQTSSIWEKTNVPMRLCVLPSQVMCQKRLWRRCKNALFGYFIFSPLP